METGADKRKHTCLYSMRRQISRDFQSVTTPKSHAIRQGVAPTPPLNEAEECTPYPSKQNTGMEGKPLKASRTLSTSQGEHSVYRNFLFP